MALPKAAASPAVEVGGDKGRGLVGVVAQDEGDVGVEAARLAEEVGRAVGDVGEVDGGTEGEAAVGRGEDEGAVEPDEGRGGEGLKVGARGHGGLGRDAGGGEGPVPQLLLVDVLPAGALDDGPGEGGRGVAALGGDVVHDAASAGRLAHDGHFGLVAAEEVDVILDPVE